MKSNNKHTKGPWKTEINEGELEIWSQDTFIAGVTHDLYFTAEKSGQHTANAALIAAAPEMIEALELLLNETRNIMHNDTVWARSKAIDAIKKARGE